MSKASSFVASVTQQSRKSVPQSRIERSSCGWTNEIVGEIPSYCCYLIKAGKVSEKHGHITSRSAARLTHISIAVPHGYGSWQWGDAAGDSTRHTCVPVLACRAASSSHDNSSIFSRARAPAKRQVWFCSRGTRLLCDCSASTEIFNERSDQLRLWHATSNTKLKEKKLLQVLLMIISVNP